MELFSSDDQLSQLGIKIDLIFVKAFNVGHSRKHKLASVLQNCIVSVCHYDDLPFGFGKVYGADILSYSQKNARLMRASEISILKWQYREQV